MVGLFAGRLDPRKNVRLEHRARAVHTIDQHLKEPRSGAIDVGAGLDATFRKRRQERAGRPGRPEEDHLGPGRRCEHLGIDIDPTARARAHRDRHEIGLRIDGHRGDHLFFRAALGDDSAAQASRLGERP
jgi:hypothetical protein